MVWNANPMHMEVQEWYSISASIRLAFDAVAKFLLLNETAEKAYNTLQTSNTTE